VLGSVSAGVPVPRGDVVNIRLQNGGGYGDPLDREPEAVLRDVHIGSVSRQIANALYGVVIANNSLDEAATTARRKEIRSNRLASMRPPRAVGGGSRIANGGAAIPWGDSLVVHSEGQHAATVACKHCGATLGPLKADWRDLAGVVTLSGEQLGPYVEVHEELVAEQFVCTNCAASLWVEVVSPSAPPAPDFGLTS
jgi:N-methylhydantoinase B